MTLTLVFSFAALSLGAMTAVLAAKNRERANDLHSLQRQCEHLTLENERVRFQLEKSERELFERLLRVQLEMVR